MIEYLPIVLTGIGLTASIIYYTSILRNANKTQEQQLQTRRIQLSTSITEKIGSKDFLRDFAEILKFEWVDVDDFLKKYDHRVNPESYAQRWTVWVAYENLGYLLREGLIDQEILFNVASTGSILVWGTYYPVIDNIRKNELGPRFMENFEYLASEMWKVCKARGYMSAGYKDGYIFDEFHHLFESET
jgi:hypothetical protein